MTYVLLFFGVSPSRNMSTKIKCRINQRMCLILYLICNSQVEDVLEMHSLVNQIWSANVQLVVIEPNSHRGWEFLHNCEILWRVVCN